MIPSTSFFRPTVCTIDLGALERNFKALRRVAGDRKFIAVVKSNAYGHGAVEIARTLERMGADRLAVVALEEAIELREAGIRTPILILGILQPSIAHTIATYRFAAAVFSHEMARALQSAVRRLGTRLPVHIKIDSGMGRLGIKPTECSSIAATLRECPNLHIEGVFTHLAKADTDPEFTAFQLKQFTEATEVLRNHEAEPPIRHAANSAALLRFPEALFDAVRPGLALYGINPLGQAGNTVPLVPVLSLSTRVLFLKQVPADTPISYGGTFRTRRPSVIATLPIGYADGLSRLRSNPPEGMGWFRRGASLDAPSYTGGSKDPPLQGAGMGVTPGDAGIPSQFRSRREGRMVDPLAVPGAERRGSSPERSVGGGVVLVRGRRAPIVGRITMDLTMIDVTEIPGVAVDDEAVLIGSQGTESVSAAEWATEVGTIPYEVLCGISVRVPRVYVGNPATHGPYSDSARRPRSGA